jgi:hypothetical protein
MGLDYRVIRRELPQGSFVYGIHEVSYRNGEPVSWTEEPVAVTAEDRDGVSWRLAAMELACRKPALRLTGGRLIAIAPDEID